MFRHIACIVAVAFASCTLVHAQQAPCPNGPGGGGEGGGGSVGGVSATGTTSGVNDHPRMMFAVRDAGARQLDVNLKQVKSRGRIAMTLFKEYEHNGRTQWKKLGRLARFERSGKGATDLKLPSGTYLLVLTGKDMRYAVSVREKQAASNDSASGDVVASASGEF